MSGAHIILSRTPVPGTAFTTLVVGLPDFGQGSVTLPNSVLDTPRMDGMIDLMLNNRAMKIDITKGWE